jgi:hypothetical protein
MDKKTCKKSHASVPFKHLIAFLLKKLQKAIDLLNTGVISVNTLIRPNVFYVGYAVSWPTREFW